MTMLTLNAGDLARALSKLAGIVPRKGQIPILANVLIDAQGGDDVILTATDLDAQVTTRVALEEMNLKPIKTTICAHTLYDVVRKFPAANTLTLDCSNLNEVIFKSGRSRFRFPALPHEDFPNIKTHGYTHIITMSAAHLLKLLAHAAPFVSTEETRYYLNGIYFHQMQTAERNTLRAVATDGHRLAQVDHDVTVDMIESNDGTALPGVIIPRGGITEILKLLSEAAKATGDVRLEVGRNSICLEVGKTVFVTKLIDGQFPDYERVIPRGQADYEGKIHRETLACAIDRVSSVRSDKASALKIEVEGDQLTVSMVGADTGAASETLDVEAVFTTSKINSLTLGFNYRYMLDQLNVIEGDEVTLLLRDGGSPAMIQDANPDAAKNALYVLMPMRV